MNLFNLHKYPKTLKGWEHRFDVPEIAYEEAEKRYNRNQKRSPDLEQAIAKDPEYAFMYAKHILRNRWPEAESVIIASPNWAYYYITEVVRQPWSEGARSIRTDRYYTQAYKDWVINYWKENNI